MDGLTLAVIIAAAILATRDGQRRDGRWRMVTAGAGCRGRSPTQSRSTAVTVNQPAKPSDVRGAKLSRRYRLNPPAAPH